VTQEYQVAESRTTVPILFKLTVAVLSVVLFLGVTELVLRILDSNLYYKNQFFPVNRDIDFPEVYRRDPQLFWRFRDDITTRSRQFSYLDYRINSHGMRGPEFAKAKSGVRILALGNSCTFGWGVPYDQIWTCRLQQAIHQRLPGQTFEVLNAGVPGYSSYQGKIYFDELLPLKPDIVLIMFGWNDHAPAGKGIIDSEEKMPGTAILDAQNLLSSLKLYQLMRKLLLTATEKKEFVRLDEPTGIRRVPPDQFSQNLTDIVRTARAHNIRPVLIIPPIAALKIYFKETSSSMHTIHAAYEERIRRVGAYERVPVVDLQQAFDQHDDLFDDAYADCTHFNANGHWVAAETIADTLATMLK
jgi:lysophospholipase L1-like esterase